MSCSVRCSAALVRQVGALSHHFLAATGQASAELSIAIVGDARIRSLNRRWRGIDSATDVLSFPLEEPGYLGDLVISLDTARARARDHGHSLGTELALYLAHGLLHLLGHDHHRPAEARRMAKEERRLLGAAGMVELAGVDRLTHAASRGDARREHHRRRYAT